MQYSFSHDETKLLFQKLIVLNLKSYIPDKILVSTFQGSVIIAIPMHFGQFFG